MKNKRSVILVIVAVLAVIIAALSFLYDINKVSKEYDDLLNGNGPDETAKDETKQDEIIELNKDDAGATETE